MWSGLPHSLYLSMTKRIGMMATSMLPRVRYAYALTALGRRSSPMALSMHVAAALCKTDTSPTGRMAL